MKITITLLALAALSFAGDVGPDKKDIKISQEDQDTITRAVFNYNNANFDLATLKARISDAEKAVNDTKAALNKVVMDIQAKSGASTQGCQVENVNAPTVDAKDAKPGMWKIACPVTEGSK